jgi:hypothetical protein
MFEYLSASIGPVVEGLEDFEKIYALEQGQYIPLRTLPGENGNSAITKWELSEEQRKALAEGADILLEVLHFKGPLAPVRMMVVAREDYDEEWSKWLCGQLKIRDIDITKKRCSFCGKVLREEESNICDDCLPF